VLTKRARAEVGRDTCVLSSAEHENHLIF